MFAYFAAKSEASEAGFDLSRFEGRWTLVQREGTNLYTGETVYARETVGYFNNLEQVRDFCRRLASTCR